MWTHLQRSLSKTEISPVKFTTLLGKAGHISSTGTEATVPKRSPKLTPKQSLARKGTKPVWTVTHLHWNIKLNWSFTLGSHCSLSRCKMCQNLISRSCLAHPSQLYRNSFLYHLYMKDYQPFRFCRGNSKQLVLKTPQVIMPLSHPVVKLSSNQALQYADVRVNMCLSNKVLHSKLFSTKFFHSKGISSLSLLPHKCTGPQSPPECLYREKISPDLQLSDRNFKGWLFLALQTSKVKVKKLCHVFIWQTYIFFKKPIWGTQII